MGVIVRLPSVLMHLNGRVVRSVRVEIFVAEGERIHMQTDNRSLLLLLHGCFLKPYLLMRCIVRAIRPPLRVVPQRVS